MTNPTPPYRMAGAIPAGGKARRPGGITKGMPSPKGHLSLIERMVVHVDLLDGISAALDRGESAVHDLWSRVGGTAVHFDNANAFANLNSSQDVEAWLAGKPSGEHR